MHRHPHPAMMLGLAVGSVMLCIWACKPKESAPDFLSKSTGPAPSNPSDKAAKSDAGLDPLGVNPSKIQLRWVQGAIPEAVVRTGSEQGNLFLPETTGGGIAVLDFDRDGLVDIVCAGGGYADLDQKVLLGHAGSLHRGVGQARFEHVRESAAFDLSAHYSAGITVGDFDGDGFQDLFVTGYSQGQLLRNLGDGTFETLNPAISGLNDGHWGASAAFFDGDGDGLSDLYVSNYANWSFDNNPICGVDARFGKGEKSTDYCGPREFKGLPDVLYRNLGDGTFENANATAGIEDSFRGLGVLAADFDEDGDVDLYVANDVDPNLLYRNDGGMKFTELARRSGVATNDAGTPEGSMGIALGDFNLDGLLDLWVTNYQNEVNALYRNNGKLQFSYASTGARVPGTDEASVGWGTAFADMDCDGDEDLIVVNGHIELKPLGSTYDQRPQILENLMGKSFRLIPRNGIYLETPQSSRGLAVADFNGDGKLDFVASRINTHAALVLNETPGCRFLQVRLVGTQSNRDAVGARIALQVGSYRATRQIVGGGSYASASDLIVHFGVPEQVGSQAKLTVEWPSGKSQEWLLSDMDREWVLVEGQSAK
jgi:hypothetical protein